MGKNYWRHLAAIFVFAFGLHYPAMACGTGANSYASCPFLIVGTDTSIEGARKSASKFCDPANGPQCIDSTVTEQKRLREAWTSQATSWAQRDKIEEIVSRQTVDGNTNWALAVAEYFKWRKNNPELVMQKPVNIGPQSITTCSTTHNYYYGIYSGSGTTTTTCRTM